MSPDELLSLVNVDLLPPNLRWLCRVLGPRKAFELAKQRGGVPLRVPVRASLEHWLVDIIGIDGLQALVEARAGEYVDVPKYDKVTQQLRHQQAHACLAAGMSMSNTALETGYTKRHVVNIQASLLEATGERYSPARVGQQDLFAELLVPCSPNDPDIDFDQLEEEAVAEQEAELCESEPIEAIDEEHREVALNLDQGAHDPFGMTKRVR